MSCSGWEAEKGPRPGPAFLTCYDCRVVQAQRPTQAVVKSITDEMVHRISEGFVIKRDSTNPEIIRCQGSLPRSWAAVTKEGRDSNRGSPSSGKGHERSSC